MEFKYKEDLPYCDIEQRKKCSDNLGFTGLIVPYSCECRKCKTHKTLWIEAEAYQDYLHCEQVDLVSKARREYFYNNRLKRILSYSEQK